MFNLFWRKKYEKNLKLYEEYLQNDNSFKEYYVNRIDEIMKNIPYKNYSLEMMFNDVGDLELVFAFKELKTKDIVRISADMFNHFEIFSEELLKLSENVKKSYKRSLLEALNGWENEYMSEMENSYNQYRFRIDWFIRKDLPVIVKEKYSRNDNYR